MFNIFLFIKSTNIKKYIEKSLIITNIYILKNIKQTNIYIQIRLEIS